MHASKLAEVEKSRSPINFFVPSIYQLMLNTPTNILCELGMRTFTGSRDMPKDLEKSFGLFHFAAENSKNERE